MAEGFLEAQRRAFEQADEQHFDWQVGHPLISRTERELLGKVDVAGVRRLLEVGCGEGANLVNLRASRGALPLLTVGLDLFVRKVQFGRKHAAPAIFVCGDALSLPFASGSFDVVLCRDLLHHVQDRLSAVRELRRVCRPGGEVWVIEPNGRNPLIALFALSQRHERGQLQTTPRRLMSQVAAVFGRAHLEMRQPMPVSRALAHHSKGVPRLANYPFVIRFLDGWDAASQRLLPPRLWAYIVLRMVNEG
jgi:ubiquinone/menaquinone biosynthesis C-methylase UbiE